MNISYTLPFSRGWDQMKTALFKPFDLNKWIRIGFTAWLAGLADCSGGSGGGNQAGKGKPDWNEFFSFPETAMEWMQSHPGWYALIVIGIVTIVALITLLIWVSSRGKFMFLHNVVNQKNDINYPWIEYKKEGNSLFKWRFAFLWITIIVFILFLKNSFLAAKDLYYGNFQEMAIFREIAWMGITFVAIFIVVGYISLFLNDFIVPLMYKHRLSASWAWYRFLPILGRYLFVFIGYGMFVFVLIVALVIAVILFGLFTCFIGFLLLAIPFIGSVILLPVSYTFRAFSIEFLAQFGDDFSLLPVTSEEV